MDDSRYTFDKEWPTGICSWCGGPENKDGLSTCCLSCWCPCIQFGRNVRQIGDGYGAPFGGDCFTAGCTFCLLYYYSFQCLMHMPARKAVRRKYNLKASPCNDFCVAWCCSTCALCQEHYILTANDGAAVAKPATS